MINEKSCSLFLNGCHSQFLPKLLLALLLSSISFVSLAHAGDDDGDGDGNPFSPYTQDDCDGVLDDPTIVCGNDGQVYVEIQEACEQYYPNFTVDCSVVEENHCDNALTYELLIPASGQRADLNEAQANSQLESQGVPADQRDCIIDKQLHAQRVANQALANNVLTNALLNCANEHQQKYGKPGQFASYVARVTSSEEDPIFAPGCACKDIVTANQGGTEIKVDFNSSDLSPKYLVLCGRGVNDVNDQGVLHYTGQSNYDPCGSESHVHFQIRSASAAGIDLNATGDDIRYTEGTQEKGVGKNCAFETGQVAHRTNHSCFHPDTNIMLGDGTYKMIKKLKAGDVVWNPLSKKAVKLSSVVVGPEPTPLIEMSFGERTLIVSERHPMIQPFRRSSETTWFKKIGLKPGELGHSPAYRIKMAGELSVGDFVVTDDGSSKQITALKRLPIEEDQLVYNLTLEGEGVALKNRSVVAEGFVTGDYLIQTAINKNKIH